MTPSRKGGKENNQDVEEIGHVNWSKENILIVCNLCNELVHKSGGNNGETISQKRERHSARVWKEN